MFFEIFLILMGGLWPLAPAAMVFVFMTRKGIARAFMAGLKKRFNDEAWIENFLEAVTTMSTLGAAVGGLFGYADGSAFTIILSVGVFLIGYHTGYFGRSRLALLRSQSAQLLLEKQLRELHIGLAQPSATEPPALDREASDSQLPQG